MKTTIKKLKQKQSLRMKNPTGFEGLFILYHLHGWR